MGWFVFAGHVMDLVAKHRMSPARNRMTGHRTSMMEIPSKVFSGHILSMGFWSLKPTQSFFALHVGLGDQITHFSVCEYEFLMQPYAILRDLPPKLQIVQCWAVPFLCYKKLVRWKPSTVPGEAGHAEVDAALKLLTSPEGANLRSEASGSAFECFIF